MSDLVGKAFWLQRHGEVTIVGMPIRLSRGWRASFEGQFESNGVKVSLKKDVHGDNITEIIDALHSAVSDIVARLGVENLDRDDEDDEEL